MTASPTMSLHDVAAILEADGAPGLARRATGPFLLEVRLEDPAARAGRRSLAGLPAPPSSSLDTTEYVEDVLLDLRRMRGAEDAVVHVIAHGCVVGRAEDCALQLDAGAVSQHHARFEEREGAWTMTDVGSTNGTFVERERLAPGAPGPISSFQRVQLGERRFVFLLLADLCALLTPVRAPCQLPIATLATELDSLGSRHFLLRHEVPYLLVDGGEGKRGEFAPTTAFALAGPGPFRIGRSHELEIPVPSKPVSKLHATLSRGPDHESWWVEDVGSSNGTTRNGEHLARGKATRLTSWDSLTFGSGSVAGLYLDPRGLLEFLSERGSARAGRAPRGGP